LRPIRDGELRKQSHNAAKSVALNIAEGAGQEGGSRGRHFKIARGSVTEVVAAYEIACAMGERPAVAEVLELGNDISAMLSGLIHGRRRPEP
jgi:four helix bundle protein